MPRPRTRTTPKGTPPETQTRILRASSPPGGHAHIPARGVGVLPRGMQFTRLTGTFVTTALGTLRDVRTSSLFTRELLHLLQGEPLACLAYDIGQAMRERGRDPLLAEQGVFAAAYGSLASVVVRTYPMHQAAKVDAHSYVSPIPGDVLHALVYRHYWSQDLSLVDLSRLGT